MTMRIWFQAAAAAVAVALFSPATASAKKGLVIITTGDTITDFGTVKSPNAGNAKVGYKYEYFGIFWVDLWTYGGTHCVYDGNRYAPISAAEAAEMLGKSEKDVSAPFLYHVPLGWLIFGPLILIGIAVWARNRKNDVSRIFKDPRYMKAVEVFHEKFAASAPPPPADGEPAPAEGGKRFEAAFKAGVDHLVETGVTRETAERNFAIMIHVLANAGQDEQKPA